MSDRVDRRRGEPLFVLAVLLTAWIGTRAMTWESPPRPLEPMFGRVSWPVAARNTAPDPATAIQSAAGAKSVLAPGASQPRPERALAASMPSPLWQLSPIAKQTAPAMGDVMASHQFLWLAATARLPVPPDIAALLRANAAAASSRPKQVGARSEPDRWSFDSWLLLRPGGADVAQGRTLASYGASQAGAVVRYRLAPGNAHRPAAYVRATQALAAGKESEVAAGISARPFAAVPVALYSEVRVTRHGGREVELRPAAFAVTELPPARLPLGLRGVAYAQAGYVGGDFATPFVDGQARIDREVGRFDLAAVRTGLGAWGGAQKGAARLDIGPTASFDLEVGDAPARLAVDYRLRIAGDAAPGRGIAVTLSTGF